MKSNKSEFIYLLILYLNLTYKLKIHTFISKLLQYIRQRLFENIMLYYGGVLLKNAAHKNFAVFAGSTSVGVSF